METNTTTTESILSWEAPSRISHTKTSRWYLIAGIITLVLVAYSLIEGSWTMTIVVLLTAGVYFLVRDVEHETHKIEIRKNHIIIDGIAQPWDAWKKFWILEGANCAELHIEPKKSRKQDFVVLIGDIDPTYLRDILGEFLPQDGEKHERLFDIISRICKL